MQFSVWYIVFYHVHQITRETQNFHPEFPRLDSSSLEEREVLVSDISELNSGLFSLFITLKD